jgi:hypothetical protein
VLQQQRRLAHRRLVLLNCNNHHGLRRFSCVSARRWYRYDSSALRGSHGCALKYCTGDPVRAARRRPARSGAGGE